MKPLNLPELPTTIAGLDDAPIPEDVKQALRTAAHQVSLAFNTLRTAAFYVEDTARHHMNPTQLGFATLITMAEHLAGLAHGMPAQRNELDRIVAAYVRAYDNKES